MVYRVQVALRLRPGGGGEGYSLLYKLYRYVPTQRVWFLSRFGLKTGIVFEHFGLKFGMFCLLV